MAYIGNQPFTTAFLTDQFSGNGSTTAFTLSAAPANTNSLLVAVTGVLQDPSTYSVSGTTLTFSAAPPSGTGNISVRFLGIPASGVVTTAYRTLTEFTATAGQTTFTPPSYTVGYINVFRNGVMLGTADYTASNGTTVVLVNAATAGDLVAIESFYVSSVLNALPTSGGTLSGALIVPNFTYTGTLTGSTSVLNIGSGQIYKDASGNVGIGTSSPLGNLDVVSSANTVQRVRTTSGTQAAYTLYQNGDTGTTTGDGLYVGMDGTEVGYLWNYENQPVVFGTNSLERARIDSSGNLLVGTTTSSLYNQNTASGLSVLPGTSANLQISTDPAGSAGNACAFLNMRNTPINGAKYVRFFYNGTTETGSISLNGTTSVAYNTSSDYRLKHDIQPMTGALARVSALKPVTYKWNADGSDGEGFIAHELAEICPQAVNGEKDAVDAEGNPVYQGIDTSFLVATLTAAIQELTAKLDAAEARIAALENKA